MLEVNYGQVHGSYPQTRMMAVLRASAIIFELIKCWASKQSVSFNQTQLLAGRLAGWLVEWLANFGMMNRVSDCFLSFKAISRRQKSY